MLHTDAGEGCGARAMELLGVAWVVSLALFAVAAWLFARGRVPPPLGMRSESGRSPAEYAFREQHAALRRYGLLCVVVGVLNLLASLFVALLYVMPEE
ncbi:MAG: hypothetical protein WDN04_00830 [Rhodospirillales bacterium]